MPDESNHNEGRSSDLGGRSSDLGGHQFLIQNSFGMGKKACQKWHPGEGVLMEVDTLLKPGDFKRGTVTRFALMQISQINAQWCWAFLISNSYRNRFESVCIKVACLHK